MRCARNLFQVPTLIKSEQQKPGSNPLLSHKDEFPGHWLKRWRNEPVFSRILDIAGRSDFARAGRATFTRTE